ncbi:hypothetical protein [Mucilaginibacter sp. CSA2-8R]|uniref:hypothetical protein n=1 Tax=Mucilaginibacter sp. CSA2-8R TaxID=3141542 RepID=UPI00315D8C94
MSTLKTETIIENIVSRLREERYGILDVTPVSISFDNDDGRLLVGNWEYARRVENGRFDIIKNNDSTIVTLDFYPISFSEYAWVGAACLLFGYFGFTEHEFLISVMSWPFIGQLIFKHYNLQSKANAMLAYVTSNG